MATPASTHVAGYLSDVPYLRHFCPELAPPLQRLVVASNGFPPPPEHAFTFGELGCGQGDSVAALAAAFPHSDFWGFDLLAHHVEHGRSLAVRGGLTNLRFVEGDFAALDRSLLPAFDYLGAHGVLSWISAEKRRALLELAAEKLKPGGLLYVGYNALPGWAALEPLRRLLLDSSPATDNSLVRARRGLEAARAMADAGAEYFTQHPTARDMLKTMEKAGLAYVAHEYLHEHWSPLAFQDLAREAVNVGLTFAGQIPLHRNVTELSFPPSLRPPSGTDRIATERLKDLAGNTFFRADLFIKGSPGSPDGLLPSDAITLAHLESTRFGTLHAAANVSRERPVGVSAFRVEGPLIEAMVERLSTKSATLPELIADPVLAPFGPAAVRTMLVQLALADIAEPRPAANLAIASGDPIAFNRAALDAAFTSQGPVILASSRAGTAITLSRLEGVLLSVLLLPDADRAASLEALAKNDSFVLWTNDQKVTEVDARLRILETELATFAAADLLKLRELGVA